MAHFTQLDEEAIESLVLEFSLGELRAWKSIAAGTINSNYQLETSEGCFFMRVNEGKSEAEVKLEIAVLTHIVAHKVASPLPRLSRAGERYARWKGKYISCFSWVPGEHVDSQTSTAEHCHAAGRALATLHQAGQSMELAEVGRGRYAHAKLVALFESFAQSADPGLAEVCERLRSEFAWLDEREAMREAAPRGLIHADLFPDNVLMEGAEVVALIDFEQACEGSFVYDLAVAINAWCFAETLVAERLRAFVAGYRELRSLSREEVALLGVELRASALRFTITRITDVYLPALMSKTPAQGKDFRRFQMRLEHWRAMEPGELLRIADLAHEPSPS